MKLISFILTILAGSFTTVLPQSVVDVTDQKIKVGAFKEESLYFGFAEGDKIIFNFEEVDGKEIKEVEIVEYPGNSKFSDFKTKRVVNKTLNVNRKSVYIFRFKNTAIGGRVCRIQIQRIPASDATKDFNSTVRWVTRQDTSWNAYTKDIIVGYDTTYVQRNKRELVSTEQREVSVFDKNQRVHSTTNSNGNRSSVFFTLPQNESTGYFTKQVVSWAYWVGVGEESNLAWKQNVQTVATLAKGAASVYFTPLGALAVGALARLAVPTRGEDVSYYIADETNKNLFFAGQQFRVFDQGKGVAGYRSFTNTSMLQGTYFICLSNDNMVQGIDANVKVVAIVETNKYIDKQYTDSLVQPRYEKKIVKEPVITTKTVPVIQN